MRGIALALVVFFHVFGQGRVSGGVDVFLFFSGFLLTGSMFRRSVARSAGRVSRHYARTLLRLLPAALTVLAAVVGAILLLRPLSAQSQDLREVRASLLYYENWELIWSQLSYGAAGPDASPLQHFWSLSLQGQFFLIWPWCVVGLVALALRIGRDPWRVTAIGTSAVTLTSFAIAQVTVQADQPVAYFHTMSRWWELTAGGLLALILMKWSPPHRLRPALGWAGLTIVLGGGFVVNGSSVFPGPWVLLPLTGAAFVLLGAGAVRGPQRILQTRPLTRLADIAYELYLWHWPILIFVLVVQGRPSAGPITGLFIVIVSTAAAWLTHVLISQPFEQAKSVQPARVLMPILAVLTTAAVVTTTLVVRSDRVVEQSLDTSKYTDEDYPGAEVVLDPSIAKDSYPLPVAPPSDVAAQDIEPAKDTPCWQGGKINAPAEAIQWCDSPTSEGGPTIALVGSSRAEAWQPAMQRVANANGWTLRTTARGGCPLSGSSRFSECTHWQNLLLDELIRIRPAAVIIEGTDVSPTGEVPERAVDPEGAAWRRLTDVGIQVFALRSPPRFRESPPECVSRLADGVTTSSCDQPVNLLYSAESPFAPLARGNDRLHELDLVPSFCPGGSCPVVLGNLITYRDPRHFTASFAATLGPAIEQQMRAALPQLFEGSASSES